METTTKKYNRSQDAFSDPKDYIHIDIKSISPELDIKLSQILSERFLASNNYNESKRLENLEQYSFFDLLNVEIPEVKLALSIEKKFLKYEKIFNIFEYTDIYY
jgi:hypothetical protein